MIYKYRVYLYLTSQFLSPLRESLKFSHIEMSFTFFAQIGILESASKVQHIRPCNIVGHAYAIV